MTMNNLHLMPKLDQRINLLRTAGFDVQVHRRGPGFCAGQANATNKIIINNWHVGGMEPDYDDDRMIVVLYHELGHLKYFATLNGNPADDAESEFQAFLSSLQECCDIARAGDKGPLRSALHFIGQRQSSGKEPLHYQTALNRIVVHPIWAQSQQEAK